VDELPAWAILLVTISGFVLGPLIGLGTALVTDRARDERLERREALDRRLTRDAARADAREDFERESLMELFDALDVFGRLANRIHFFEITREPRNEPYGTSSLPDDLDEEFREATQRARRWALLVLDSDLRESVLASMGDVSTHFVSCRGLPRLEAHDRLSLHLSGFQASQEQVASRIRGLQARPAE
jgi:hypothetical protein